MRTQRKTIKAFCLISIRFRPLLQNHLCRKPRTLYKYTSEPSWVDRTALITNLMISHYLIKIQLEAGYEILNVTYQTTFQVHTVRISL